MPKAALYDDTGNYTDYGKKAAKRICKVMEPRIKRMLTKGVSGMEIELFLTNLMHEAATFLKVQHDFKVKNKREVKI